MSPLNPADANNPTLHIAKATAADPALRAAVARAIATNDTASLVAMGPTLQAAADQASLTGGAGLSSLMPQLASAIPQLTTALTPQGNVVQLPAPQQAALTQMAQQQAAVPMQQYQNQVARAQVRRVQSSVDPQLEAIRRDLEHRSNQIQATSEHRNLEARDAFRRNVIGRLSRIERDVRIMKY